MAINGSITSIAPQRRRLNIADKNRICGSLSGRWREGIRPEVVELNCGNAGIKKESDNPVKQLKQEKANNNN